MSSGFWIFDWLTLSLAIAWTVGGAILVLLGWLTLPRHPENAREETSTKRASSTLRIIGGAILAAVATTVGAYTALRGGGWATDSVRGFLEFVSYLAKLIFSASLHRGVAIFFTDLRLGTLAISHAIPTLGATLWKDRAYEVVNTTALAVVAVIGAFAGWLSTSSRWRVSGVLTYLGLDLVALGLIGFSLVVVENSSGPIAQGLGIWLLGIELFGLGLFLAYQFYTIEYLAGRGPGGPDAPTDIDPNWHPFVLVQVACYNEPAGIVRETLAAVKKLHYPADRYAVQLVDDSTDPALIPQLQKVAEEAGVRFVHRDHRRGFKGGALNDALAWQRPTPDVVAIVDADYWVDPEFLVVAVQPFRNPGVGFVQTPQSYRNAPRGSFPFWYALADAYFYQVVQPVRARVQSLIFCGTMGLVRVKALKNSGGWSEKCVTEDAELSLRMLANGWRGVYLKKPLGWGLAPEQMSAVRSQHRRWAFGGLQMLRINRNKLSDPVLTSRQRRDFTMSGWFWMDGLFLTTLTATLATIVVATWFGISLPIQSSAALAVVASAPLLLMLDGVFKIRLALRTQTHVTYRDVLGIMGFWYAIKINDLRAALRGWSGAKLSFVRTPKESGTRSPASEDFRAAISGSVLETTVAGILFGIAGLTAWRWGILAHGRATLPDWFLLGWLIFYGFVFLCAPMFDYYSRRAIGKSEGTPAPAPPKGTGRPTA
jgi:cellulose synthase/poly-beta-1,6-N-acetylglucosamine synthase-like glycosyltransferase